MSATSPGWYNWQFGDYGQAGFGQADLQAMQAQGYSQQQIGIFGQSAAAQGLHINKDAQSYLDTVPQSPWGYTQFGGPRYGQQDLQATLGMGGTYKDVQKYSDFANQNQIGTSQDVMTWLKDNKDNYAYMDANQQREIGLQDQMNAEARAQKQWEANQLKMKELNPRISSQNQQMKAGSAGGVATQRSEAFRREGGSRSTKQASRGMFIESLNI